MYWSSSDGGVRGAAGRCPFTVRPSAGGDGGAGGSGGDGSRGRAPTDLYLAPVSSVWNRLGAFPLHVCENKRKLNKCVEANLSKKVLDCARGWFHGIKADNNAKTV